MIPGRAPTLQEARHWIDSESLPQTVQRAVVERSTYTWMVAAVFLYVGGARSGIFERLTVTTDDLVVHIAHLTQTSPVLAFAHFDTLGVLAIALLFGRRVLAPGSADTAPGLGLTYRVVAALVLAGCLFSLPASPDFETSAQSVIGRCVIFFFIWMVWRSRPSAEEVQLWLNAFLIGIMLVLISGAIAYYQSFGLPTSAFQVMQAHFNTRTSFVVYEQATYGFPASTVEVIALVFPSCVLRGLAAHTSWWTRVLSFCALALIAINLLITFEREAFVVFPLIGLVILLYFVSIKWWPAVVAISVAGAVAFLLIVVPALADPRVIADLLGVLNASTGSNSATRLILWETGLRLIELNPSGYGVMVLQSLPLPTNVAHNIFVDAGLTTGIVGMLGVIVWVVSQIGLLVRSIAYLVEASPRVQIALALQVGALAYVSVGFFQGTSMYSYGEGVEMLGWFGFPMLAAALLFARPTGEEPAGAGSQMAVARRD